MWRDLAIGLSLANICFLRVWSDMLTYSQSSAFWMKHPPTPVEFFAAILNVMIVGCVLGLGVNYLRRTLSKRAMLWTRRAFLLSLAIPLNAIRTVLANQPYLQDYLRSGLFDLMGQRGVLLLTIGLVLVALILVTFWARPLSHIAAGVFLALFPFVPIVLVQAALGISKYNPTPFRDKQLAKALPVKEGAPRVIWIIFDETDYRIAFVDRNPTLQLPELDRLRGEALFATHAQPPGPQTPVSMPGYVTGRQVSDSNPIRPDELMLRYKGTETVVPWSEQPNVFQKARQSGFNTAVVGWFHPYCRVINSGLVACDWWQMAMQYNSMGETIGELMPNQARSLFETTLFSAFGQSLSTQQHVRTYHQMLARARQAVVDRNLGLTLIHLPVPHAPHAYDRSTGQFTRRNSPIEAYVDSLALVDRTVADLRRTMEQAGMWDGTTVLISSDHGYRGAEVLDGKKDSRIPFILKLAGQKQGRDYSPEFNTIVTSDLLLSILRGELQTPEAVSSWLDGRCSAAPSL
jgi:hypothetical protein